MNSTGAEIRIAYEIVQNTIIVETTEVFLEKFMKVFNLLGGYDTEDLELIFEPPISYLSDIKSTDVLTINEQREILGKDRIEGGDVFYVQLQKGTEQKVEEGAVEEVVEDDKVIEEKFDYQIMKTNGKL